jgi:hypothetical protein
VRIYIETTIPSYLVARPSRDVIQTARQMQTQDWWDHGRTGNELYTSLVTVQECAAGDPQAAALRSGALQGIPLLEIVPEVETLASDILQSGLLPLTADRDAAHLAVATYHGLDILLTWNCRHIANATIRRRLQQLMERRHHTLPTICNHSKTVHDRSDFGRGLENKRRTSRRQSS